MTRINLVPVDELTDQHLMAEYREITMVPAALRRSLRTKTPEAIAKSIPADFTLNTGHVRFFYNKMWYLNWRYVLLQEELRARNYKLDEAREFMWSDLSLIPQQTWWPSTADMDIVRARIRERIMAKPEWYRYKGKPYVWAIIQNKFERV
jgi:deoxyribonuclease (pyrimidine dimer)